MPHSIAARCSEPGGCPELAVPGGHGKCGEHRRVGWQGRATTQERYGISGSAQQTLHRTVLREAGGICYDCGLPGANEVDHIIPIHLGGSRTDRANLGAIHADPCHAAKTARENAERRAARARRRAAIADAGSDMPAAASHKANASRRSSATRRG